MRIYWIDFGYAEFELDNYHCEMPNRGVDQPNPFDIAEYSKEVFQPFFF